MYTKTRPALLVACLARIIFVTGVYDLKEAERHAGPAIGDERRESPIEDGQRCTARTHSPTGRTVHVCRAEVLTCPFPYGLRNILPFRWKEKLDEEKARTKDIFARLEREKELEIESASLKYQVLEKDLSTLKKERERMEADAQNLYKTIDELRDQLHDVQSALETAEEEKREIREDYEKSAFQRLEYKPLSRVKVPARSGVQHGEQLRTCGGTHATNGRTDATQCFLDAPTRVSG